MSPPRPLGVGDIVDRKYRILGRLGAGGSGTVFEAEHVHLVRRVALKVLEGAVADLDQVERLKREARIAERMDHPNIVDVFDFGRDELRGVFFIVEELLVGRDLRAHLAERGKLPPHEAFRLVAPVVDALVELHAAGVIHRDIKPENIFLTTSRRGAVVPKLIDFGVSKDLSPEARARGTAAGVRVGTPRYMAPEQARGDATVDARADVWSMGAVLHELIVGETPFPELRMSDESPPPVATRAPLPEELAAVVDRALQGARERRFESMAALRDAIRALSIAGIGARRTPDEVSEEVSFETHLTERSTSGPREPRRRVLVADDEASARRAIARVLAQHDVTEATDGVEALARLDGHSFDLVITDLQMPGRSGVDVVRAAVRAKVPVIMVTGTGTPDTAMQVMRLGAVNYIAKPFDAGALARAVTDVLTANEMSCVLGAEVESDHPGFLNALERVERVADTDATVLLVGETGTGKEVLARFLHRLSHRRARSFVTVDAGGLSAATFERELFGEVSGGAEHRGLVHEALGGTLYLDDVSRLPLECQWRIQRFVEDRAWAPVGEARKRKADLRILASTSVDLAGAQRAFSAALYHRLAVVQIVVPPLRERRGDIRALAGRFLEDAEHQHRRGITGFDEAALDLLCAQRWPGNVRELQNVVTSVAMFKKGGGAITRADLERERASSLPPPVDDALGAERRFEVDVILEALGRSLGGADGDRELTALDRALLAEKIRQRRAGGV